MNSPMLDLDGLTAFIDAHFRTDMFRLEALPAYDVGSDGSDYHRYVQGLPGPDLERARPWREKLARDRDLGKHHRRVRIIHTPPTPYELYACEWAYVHNVPAGMNVRILDLAETTLDVATVEALLAGDFYLFDDDTALTMRYTDAGAYLGSVEVDDPTGRQRLRRLANAAWEVSVPFPEWWADHPSYHRD